MKAENCKLLIIVGLEVMQLIDLWSIFGCVVCIKRGVSLTYGWDSGRSHKYYI